MCGNRALRQVAGDDIDDPGVWAVTCFVVKVGHRRRGLAARPPRGCRDRRPRRGAHTLEGHPVDVEARGGKASSADLYHGTLSTFAAAGFVEVGRTGPGRPVVRLTLG